MNETPAWILGSADDDADDDADEADDTTESDEPAAMVPPWLVSDE